MACGGGTLAQCAAGTASQTQELQAAGDCIVHGLNKQPLEAMGAGGDVTCADVFSSQLQEVVLDLGVSDPPCRKSSSCLWQWETTTSVWLPMGCPPSTAGVTPTSQWLVFSGVVPQAPCTLPGRALTSPSPQHGLAAGMPSNTLLLLV